MDKKQAKIDTQDLTPEVRQFLDDENLERSIRRTQSEISDIVECNPFEWFGTFTFAPDKVQDRYDDSEIYRKMSKWLNNTRRHSPDLVYLLVPERHKDSALHFHALIGGLNAVQARLIDSTHKWQHQPVYNIQSFLHGFTNFTRIRDKAKTANYCRKYITKALMTEKSKRRYWVSRNAARPTRVVNLEYAELLFQYPIDQNIALSQYENDHVKQTTLFLKV